MTAALRVGFTGHRPDRLSGWSRLWLPGRIRDRLRRLARAAAEPPVFVCSLAEGADRAAARMALEDGWRLVAVLPCPPDLYEGDFHTEGSRREFRRLLAQAQETQVITGVAPGQVEAYLAAGQAMLDRIDVLLAVYDGGPSRGSGGVRDLMDRAAARGLPVEAIRVGAK